MKTFIRYTVSGGLATAAHFIVLIALIELVKINPVIATSIGFVAAIGVNYTFQYHWTFVASGSHRVTLIRYIIVTLAMMGVNAAIFWALTEQLGTGYILAQIIATGMVMLANFHINQRYTFASQN